MTTATTVDEYLAALPDERRAVLEGIRATIRAAAPDAAELIAYQMPAYRADGRFLVSFAAFKRHLSLFPASDAVVAAVGKELEPFLAEKATIRFTTDDPIPPELVTRIVQVRLAELADTDGHDRRRRPRRTIGGGHMQIGIVLPIAEDDADAGILSYRPDPRRGPGRRAGRAGLGLGIRSPAVPVRRRDDRDP